MSKVKLPFMIDYYRKKNNLTMKQLGEKLGKSESAISKWIKGVRSPMVEDLEKISMLFDVPVENLMFGGDDKSKISSIETIYNKLEPPRQEIVYNCAETQLQEQNNNVIHHDFSEKRNGELRGALSAGTGISNYYEDIADEGTFEWRKIEVPEDAPRNFDYVYVVSGDSMEPMFHNEDIVYVKELSEDERSSLDTQGVYVVRVNGEYYIKKIRFTDDKMHLISLNKEYEDLLVTEFDTVKVVAKVIL